MTSAECPIEDETAPRTEVQLHGEYDLPTAGDLAAVLAEAMSLDEGADLVLDLRDLRFMDASSVTVLIRAKIYLADHDRALVLRSPSPIAFRVLQICGLGDLIELGPARSAP